MTDISTDHELDVLSQLQQNESAKQRDIAHAIGLSLGMTNSILKRLVTKGLLTMRKINSRNIHYLVTPEGIDMIARRSYRYLRRTVGHVVRYKERLLEVFRQAALPPPEGKGVKTVVLVGESDLDFVVEWCAEKAGLGFDHQIAPEHGVHPDAFELRVGESAISHTYAAIEIDLRTLECPGNRDS